MRGTICILRLIIFIFVVFAFPSRSQTPLVDPHGDLNLSCEECHSKARLDRFEPRKPFDHSRFDFALLGQHKNVNCRSCHKDLRFANTASRCMACHTDIHRGQLGDACDRCHTPEQWTSLDKMTQVHQNVGFPLLGVHREIDCSACHRGPREYEFAGTPVACAECHRSDYDAARNPNHTLADFSLHCQQCHGHSSLRWSGATFRHSGSFQLKDRHNSLSCQDCHDQIFRGQSQECVACHLNDYQQTVNPPHQQLGFPIDCLGCHSQRAWSDASFDHTLKTGYALSGAHATVACDGCHVNGQFKGLSRECYVCHQGNYDNTLDPNHKLGTFDRNCLTCHTDNSWKPSTFNHSTKTIFALTGAHLAASCAQCHSTQFKGTPASCFSCHQSDYTAAINPNHVTNQFSHECLGCHTNSAWRPATFSHANTRFQITGAHIPLQCVDCHRNGYTNTPYTCYACHQTDYDSSLDPNHKLGLFDQNCLTCHTDNTWKPSTFNHNTRTTYVLSGAHLNVNCAGCHSTRFDGTPANCDGCHHGEYTAAANPNHSAAGFPLQCESCHRITTWSDVTYNHDGQYFPIYSGKHAGEWSACITCHDQAGNFSLFTCLNCHEHNATETNNKHREVNGYSYNSTACYTCHPQGKAED